MADTSKLDSQLHNLKARGVHLPRNSARAKLDAHSMHKMANTPGDLQATIQDGLPGAANVEDIEANTRIIRAMREQRTASRIAKQASSGDVYAAIPRFYDPLEYWDLSGLPWNMADEGHRHKLHKWLRLYYATHYLVPILIDIFSRFPLVGMEIESKDSQIRHFYEDLFLDQLRYPEFLVSLGREFWTCGEAFPLASFDEDLGVWEREELLNPEDIIVENFPLLGSKQLKISPPDYMKKLVQQKSPPKEYKQLELNFPELIPYLQSNENIPISGVLLKQVANTLNDWDDHGTPILLRGLRTLMHEEKLLASQDAIAERLYSPLILAKLGIMDLGDGQPPWIPTPDELDMVRDDMDIALSSDFRLLVYHFGLEIELPFGREQMPRLGDDFDRIERRIMQIFGVNPSLLSAGSSTQPYASSALQAEFLNQVLKTFQNYLKRHFQERAAVVAEAQEHYDYEVKGSTRVPIYEDVVEYDEEGNKRIVRKNKLLIPDIGFQTLDLRDEATERQFLQSLRQMGVPISDDKLMIGVEWEIKDEIEEYNDELKEKTIKQQRAKMETYYALQVERLPIPPDLKAEVEAAITGQPGGTGMPGGGGGGGGPGGMPGMNGAPPGGSPGEALVMPPAPPGLGPAGVGQGGAGGMGTPPPATPLPGQRGTVPEISNERRPGMPKPTHVQKDLQKEGSEKTSEEGVDNSENPSKIEKFSETLEEVPREDQERKGKKYSLVDEPPDTTSGPESS